MLRATGSLLPLALAFVLAAAPAQGQGRSRLLWPGKRTPRVTLDLATGTVTRAPKARLGVSASTVTTFENLDLSGYAAVDTGSGNCEWIDAGVKAGGASELMTGFTTAYCSAALDPSLGGPGGSFRLSFWQDYAKGGSGGAPTGEELATFCLTGLPANTAASSFQGGYRCYFLHVKFPAPLCFPDGPIGYSWQFTDVGVSGSLAATFPLLSCVQSCAGPGPDGQGMTDCIDRYCPPGSLASTFSFGSAAGFTTSIAMEIHEEAAAAPLADGDSKGKNTCYVACTEGPDLLDKELAQALRAKLGKDGYDSLVFLITSCSGGGFLEELGKSFADAEKPIYATSACAWNGEASAAALSVGGKIYTETRWSNVYLNVHRGLTGLPFTNSNPKESAAFLAAQDERAWTARKKKEVEKAQCLDRAQGGDERLGGGTGGSGATTHRAILFSATKGADDAYMWNDIGELYKSLKSGHRFDEIKVLYGNGTAPANVRQPKDRPAINGKATAEKLLDAIQGLQVDGSTQVFVYVGGHGNYEERRALLLRPAPNAVCGNTAHFGELDETQQALLASGRASPPFVDVAADALCGLNVSPGYEVFLNGTYLGSLAGGAPTAAARFEFDAALLQASGNDVSLRNTDPSAGDLSAEIALSVGTLARNLEDTFTPRGGLTPGGSH